MHGPTPQLDEHLAHELPLPLSQLYLSAHFGKTANEKHDAAYFLWEASLKLLGSIAIVDYAALKDQDLELAARLKNLARPSFGHWWEFVRRLVPIHAETGDSHYLRIRECLLGRVRDDLPRLAGLDAQLIARLDGKPSVAKSNVRLTELCDRIVSYRNKYVGHRGLKKQSFYAEMWGPLLLGAAEFLTQVDVLAGRRIIFISEVSRLQTGDWLVKVYDLKGPEKQRTHSLYWNEQDVATLPRPNQIYAVPGIVEADSSEPPLFRSLHPLLICDEEASAVYFLNGRKGKKRAEYLSYDSGEFIEQEGLERDRRQLLVQILGGTVDDQTFEQWAAAAERDDPKEPMEPPESAPRCIGEFELLSEIGRGEQGIVYRAWQPSLGRQVALKKLLRVGVPELEGRFKREIRALGRVDHPNVVKTFTSGSDDTNWFFTMELVEGAPLDMVCGLLSGKDASTINNAAWKAALSRAYQDFRDAERPVSDIPSSTTSVSRDHEPEKNGDLETVWTQLAGPKSDRDFTRNAVEIIRQVALAAHALHEAKVIHRDIKPGNIILTPDGAHAVLMDLGLVQMIDQAEGTLTRSRQFVGTLRYASPEQVLAAEKLNRKTDIYSLGATLWELLTLQPLHGVTKETPLAEAMRLITSVSPKKPSKFNPTVPHDLDTIVMTCLDKDPQRRYSTAAALAEDLGRWQRFEPVQVEPPTLAYIARKYLRRHWVAVGAVAASLLALILVPAIVGVGWLAVSYKSTSNELEREREKAVQESERANRLGAQLSRKEAAQLEAENDWLVSLIWSANALSMEKSERRKQLLFQRVQNGLRQVPRLVQAWPVGNPIRSLQLSSDGLYAAVIDSKHAVHLLNRQSGERVPLSMDGGLVSDLSFSPDSRILACALDDNTALLWQILEARPLAKLEHDGPVNHVQFSPAGHRIVTSSDDGTARLWRADTGELVRSLPHDGAVRHATFSHDGSRVITCSLDGTARLWDADNGNPAEIRLAAPMLQLLPISIEGRGIVRDALDEQHRKRTYRFVSPLTGNMTVSQRAINGSPIDCLLRVLGADEKLLAENDDTLDSLDSRLSLDVVAGEVCLVEASSVADRPKPFEEFEVEVSTEPKPRSAVPAETQDRGRSASPTSRGESTNRMQHRGQVVHASFSPDDATWATIEIGAAPSMDEPPTGGVAFVWSRKAVTAVPLHELDLQRQPEEQLLLSPSGRWLARNLAASGNNGYSVTSSDSSNANGTYERAVADGAEQGVEIWDVSRPGMAQSMQIDLWRVLAFDPSANSVLGIAPDRSLVTIDIETRQSRKLESFPGTPINARLANRGKVVVHTSQENGLQAWETTTGRSTNLASWNDLTAFALASGGRWIGYGKRNGDVDLWDLELSRRYTIGSHQSPVIEMAFSHDGRFVASADYDGVIQLWSVAERKLEKTLVGHEDAVNSIAFHPDSRYVASGSSDLTVRIWDRESGSAVQVLPKHSTDVTQVAFTPDGRRLLSLDAGGGLRYWDLHRDVVVSRELSQSNLVAQTEFLDDSLLLTRNPDRSLSLWNFADGLEQSRWTLDDERTAPRGLTPDRRNVIYVGDRGAYLLDAQTSLPATPLLKHQGAVSAAEFDPSGRFLATGGEDGAVQIWDLYNPLMQHTDSSGRRLWIANDPGSHIASIDSGSVIIRSIDGSDPEVELQLHGRNIAQGWLSPDARQLGVLYDHGTLEITNFNAKSVTLQPTTAKHVAFCPGEKICAILHDAHSEGKSLAAIDEPYANRSTDGPFGGARDPRDLDFSTMNFSTSPAMVPNSGLQASGGRSDFYTAPTPYEDPDRQLWIISTQDGSVLSTVPAPGVQGSAFSDDGQWLIMWMADGRVMVRPWRAGHSADTASTAEGFVGPGVVSAAAGSAAIYTPSGLVLNGQWERMGQPAPNRSEGLTVSVIDFALDRTGQFLAAASDAGDVILWDRAAKKELMRLRMPAAKGVALSADANLLAAWTDSQARVWDAATGEALSLPIRADIPIDRVSVHDSGKLVIRLQAGGVRLVDLIPPAGQKEEEFSRLVKTALQQQNGREITVYEREMGFDLSSAFQIFWQTGNLANPISHADTADWHLERSDTAAARQNWAIADWHLQRAEQNGAPTGNRRTELKYQRARSFFANHEMLPAFALIDECVNSAPEDSAYLFVRAQLHEYFGRFDAALADYTRLIELDVDKIYKLARLKRGNIYQRGDQWDDGIADFIAFARANPSYELANAANIQYPASAVAKLDSLLADDHLDPFSTLWAARARLSIRQIEYLTVDKNGSADLVIDAKHPEREFEFISPVNGSIVIRQRAAEGSTIDSVLRVLDANRQLIGENDDDETQDGVRDSRVEIDVHVGQSFAIVASAYQDSSGAFVLSYEHAQNNVSQELYDRLWEMIKNPQPQVRRGALRAVSELPVLPAGGAVLVASALRDPDEMVRNLAFDTLERLDVKSERAEVVAILAGYLRNDDQFPLDRILTLIEKIAPQSDDPVLVDGLMHALSIPEHRLVALKVLTSIGRYLDRQQLSALLADENWKVRMELAHLLAKTPDDVLAEGDLAQMLGNLAMDNDVDVRNAALQAIEERLDRNVAQEMFSRRLDAPVTSERLYAISCLLKLGQLDDEVVSWISQSLLNYPIEPADLDEAADAARTATETIREADTTNRNTELLQRVIAIRPRLNRDDAEFLQDLGDHLVSLGEPETALDSFQAAASICSQLLQEDPTDGFASPALSNIYDAIASIHSRKGDRRTATEFYLKSLANDEARAENDPDNIHANEGLGWAYMNLAKITTETDGLEAAQQWYHKLEQVVATALATRDDVTDGLRESRITFLEFLGANPAKTVAEREAYAELMLDVAGDEDSSPGIRAHGFNKMAQFFDLIGKPHIAYDYFVAELTIRQEMALGTDPADDANYQLGVVHEWLADICLEIGRTAEAVEHGMQCVRLNRARVASPSAPASASNSLAWGLLWLANAEFQAGKISDAIQHQDEFFQIRQRGQLPDDLAHAHEVLADGFLAIDNIAAAADHSGEEVTIRRQLATSDDSLSALHNLAVSLQRSARVALAAGELPTALDQLEESLDKERNKSSPLANDVAQALEALADAQMRTGQINQAMTAYRDAVQYRTERWKSDSTDIVAKRSLSKLLRDVAAANRLVGRFDDADKYLRDAAQLEQDLLDNLQRLGEYAQQPIAAVYQHLAEFYRLTGNFGASRRYLDSAKSSRQAFVEADPSNANAKRDLRNVCIALGNLLLEQGQWEGAKAEFDHARGLSEHLDQQANGDTRPLPSVRERVHLAADVGRLAKLELHRQAYDDAKAHLDHALAMLDQLESDNQLETAVARQLHREISNLSNLCDVAPQMIADLQAATSHWPKTADGQHDALIFRAIVMARRAEYDQVQLTADALRALGPEDPSVLYDLAVCYAQCGQTVQHGRAIEELTEPERQIREQYANAALAALGEAIVLGFNDAGRMLLDERLHFVRKLPAYSRLMEQEGLSPPPGD